MNDIGAFIFDLDGTLLDSEIVWVEAYGKLLRYQGFAVSPHEALGVVYGKAYRDIYAAATGRFPNLPWSSEEMEGQLRLVFQGLRAERDLRIPGSIALLLRLAARYPVCVVSGSPRTDVDEGIRLAGIAPQLRFALASEDYRPGKPSPAGFLMASAKLGVPPARCLVFEDSAAGVTAAKAAGMSCVALARPGRPAQDLARADLVLDDLAKFQWDDNPMA